MTNSLYVRICSLKNQHKYRFRWNRNHPCLTARYSKYRPRESRFFTDSEKSVKKIFVEQRLLMYV